MIAKDNKVIHANKAILKIIGKDNIHYLDELDQSLVMDQPAMSKSGKCQLLQQKANSFRNLSTIKEPKRNNTFHRLFGRVKKTNKRF